ncbi:MAG: hypothetical protein E7293_06450, partial [Lachnospiraceae bacterium]|nr:hypothetical protein [Lachnospiraceae bacterium]
MKQTRKTIFTLLLVMFMALIHAGSASATVPVIIFEGMQEGFVYTEASSYTDTDLFGGFQDVMPGDRLTQIIRFENQAKDSDYIKLYIKALVHDEQGNPLAYDEVQEALDGKDQSGQAGQRNETVATMQDFLSQLTMRIYNGTQLIYEASPDQAGALTDNVYLGTLFTGESLELKVELDVPIELDNTYANRVGEVDWIFLAEGFNYEQLTVHK